MAANLSLLHNPQKGDGYCLPACVQMVLAYLDISQSQESIGKTLELNPPFGTRHSNIKNPGKQIYRMLSVTLPFRLILLVET